jgi:hypothetical protein
MNTVPHPYFDQLSTLDYPKGCWACGFPGEDCFYGDTAKEALSKWLVENGKNGEPITGIHYFSETSSIDPDARLPSCVEFVIGRALVGHIIELGQLAKTRNFSEILTFSDLANWFYNDEAPESEFYGGTELCVSLTNFWFSADLSGHDVNMTSTVFDIKELVAYFDINTAKTVENLNDIDPQVQIKDLQDTLARLEREAKKLSEEVNPDTSVINDYVKAVAANFVDTCKVKSALASLFYRRKERFTLDVSPVGKRKHILTDNASDSCEDPVLYRFSSSKQAKEFKAEMDQEHGQYFLPKK